ncbi:pyridoxal phosphate-dependent transferase [Kockovaella imperatae]|uniref:alanine--glyoxylate transaminase n=1 Tax=Kockovaella imperatae TaxID=4999 RepID=A0A1Y1UC65_9TREE|nr:pyridoxal phosphate-dependent transferase [Kockovaella imperatae]ORX35631.1 pyridoxal phosphate-dependent transferase [Kockovaella imperatae]
MSRVALNRLSHCIRSTTYRDAYILRITRRSLSITMSAQQEFHQAPHKLLVIPGPIEFSDPVLAANATPGTSHVSPAFAPIFGDCLRMLKQVLYAEKEGNQPFLIAGSGTMGWDQVAANLMEQGDEAVVLNTGYFGAAFADCLEAYGAKVTKVTAEVGGVPSDEQIVKALESKPKLLTITHVDTSTGVLSPAAHITSLVQKHSPSTLIALDAVCAVASEEIRFDDWGLDVVISATQKGLGAPPGLSVLMASKRAMETFHSRKQPVLGYYLNWKNWIPIMQGYEAGTPKYFATPPVQLIYALHTSLKSITSGPSSLEERFEQHKQASAYVKDSLAKLGFGFVPLDRKIAANGMTAVKYPKGFAAADILPKLAEKDIVVAAGLHKAIASEYFRIGHMGITVTDKGRGDLDKILNGIQEVLKESGKSVSSA